MVSNWIWTDCITKVLKTRGRGRGAGLTKAPTNKHGGAVVKSGGVRATLRTVKVDGIAGHTTCAPPAVGLLQLSTTECH